MSSLLGFVSLAGWVLVVAGAGLAISNASQNRKSRPGVTIAVIGLIIGALFFIAGAGVVEVGPNEVAVVFQQIGGNPATNSLWAQPLGPGIHIIFPFINVPTIYSTRIENYTMSGKSAEGKLQGDDAVEARTRDGQEVFIDASVLFSIHPLKANTVHVRWQKRYEDDFVRSTVRTAIREVVSAYSADDLYSTKRAEAQLDVDKVITPKFDDNGLTLNELQIRNISFSPAYIKAVEDKVVAQQQAEQAKQEAERARTIAKGQADAAVTAAQGRANAAIAEAEGEAKAIELRASADAKALALINEQISKNPALVQWRYIEKLAANVSLILLPSNSPFLFDLQSLLNQGKGGTTISTNDGATAAAQPTQPPAAATPEATPAR
ncbi:MAG: prohibitin family protein [Anaerolineae bacterium]|nr:prohibitin family protein [Anaerolineae bacterium]